MDVPKLGLGLAYLAHMVWIAAGSDPEVHAGIQRGAEDSGVDYGRSVSAPEVVSRREVLGLFGH